MRDGGLNGRDLRIRGVVGIRDVDSSVENGHVMSPTLMELVQECLAFFVREGVWVILKVAIRLHVVDIGPVFEFLLARMQAR